MKPGRSHRRYFSSDLQGTVLKIFLGVGRGGTAGEGKAQTDRQPLTRMGVLHRQPEAAAESRPDWWYRCEQVEDPQDGRCSWEEGAARQGRQRKTTGTPDGRVHPGVGYWLAAAGCLETGRRGNSRSVEEMRRRPVAPK